ncbi:MAG TPA: hypothetical protein VJO12_04255 [Stellaceae bacterium]|nr:hypothetical protein [Stellaceae bacterium]
MKRKPRSALRRMLLSATALVLGASVAQAEDAVLVSSSVAGYVPGTIIGDTQTLALPDGAKAVLLFRSGEMLELKGPFDGRLVAPAGKSNASGIEALVQALRGEGIDASAVGATRGFPQARLGQRVTIDPHRSAIYCIGPDDTLWLRRPTAGTPSAQLRRRGNVRAVSWPGNAAQIEWPADLLVEDGDRFETLDAAGTPVATIILRRLDAGKSDTAWIAASFLAGCHEQAEPALRELAHDVEQARPKG